MSASWSVSTGPDGIPLAAGVGVVAPMSSRAGEVAVAGVAAPAAGFGIGAGAGTARAPTRKVDARRSPAN